MSSPPSFTELEAAAEDVIRILRGVPEFASARVAIIGGMSLWKYLDGYRTTEDVDFLTTVQGAPSAVENKLLVLPNTPFQQLAQIFYYRLPNGKSIQIDMTPDWLVGVAVPITSVQPGSLPYISALDLLVFKINCCGLRPNSTKKIRDATDARTLVDDLRSKGPIILPPTQKNAVLQDLDDVARFSGKDKAWWNAQLRSPLTTN
ncbi:hypothetical protein ACJ73_03899 [Blastomyces percursus]|uniref:Uncharacterized protein n=1 Tax=Blastomyces percursus TaxID=1658174 RepID=A0A1J9Q8E3_9EURO|nr:hypothetical protein ACJ73_03899 [Blastomyces percursus]